MTGQRVQMFSVADLNQIMEIQKRNKDMKIKEDSEKTNIRKKKNSKQTEEPQTTTKQAKQNWPKKDQRIQEEPDQEEQTARH